MKTTRVRNTGGTVVLLVARKAMFKDQLPRHVLMCSGLAEVEYAVAGATTRATCVSFTRGSTDLLLERTVHHHRAGPCGSRLIVLTPPRPESIPALLGLFYPVFGLVGGLQWLPGKQPVEAIMRHDAPARFISGNVDRTAKMLALLRGDGESIVVPFMFFPKSGDGTQPDFERFQLSDYGRTVVLGDYEAAAGAVLYEVD